jgi:hypothetical protein
MITRCLFHDSGLYVNKLLLTYFTCVVGTLMGVSVLSKLHLTHRPNGRNRDIVHVTSQIQFLKVWEPCPNTKSRAPTPREGDWLTNFQARLSRLNRVLRRNNNVLIGRHGHPIYIYVRSPAFLHNKIGQCPSPDRTCSFLQSRGLSIKTRQRGAMTAAN